MQHYDRPPTEILLPSLRDGRLERQQDRQPVEAQTYYGVPTIKTSTWSWYIPLYFFIGGVASGVSFIGALAELFGGKGHRTTVRHSRYLSVILAAICPIPLILDLGRPWRFFRMLRIVKLSSPLNLGTWILTGFGALSALLAVRQAAEDNVILKRKSAPGRLATLLPSGPVSVLHGLFGMALGGYTGTLLAATVVPLWASAGVLLGPLFLAASATSGAAALVLTGVLTRHQSREARRDIQVIANVASAVQLGLATAHETFTPERVNRPLRKGLWGRVFRYGAVGGGLFLPMGLRFLARISGRRLEPAISATAGVCTLLGTLAERFAIVEAGKVSAHDPIAYQEMTQGPKHRARPSPLRQALKSPTISPTRERVAASDI